MADAGPGNAPDAGASVAKSDGWVRDMVPYSQAFGPLLALLAIICGWIWVSRDNNQRERRKELRGQLNDIRALVRQVEESARSYFEKTATDLDGSHLSVTIKMDLQHLAGLLRNLRSREDSFTCDHDLVAFRVSVTGNDFDSSTRQPRPASDRRFLEICHAGLNLVDALERAFSTKYKV